MKIQGEWLDKVLSIILIIYTILFNKRPLLDEDADMEGVSDDVFNPSIAQPSSLVQGSVGIL